MKKMTLAMLWALLLVVGACKSGTQQAQPEATEAPAETIETETEEAPSENK